jgi:hypothetical protein
VLKKKLINSEESFFTAKDLVKWASGGAAHRSVNFNSSVKILKPPGKCMRSTFGSRQWHAQPGRRYFCGSPPRERGSVAKPVGKSGFA